MYWLYLLVIAPLWGMISAQLFLQTALSVANFLIAVAGLIKRKVPFGEIAAMLTASLFSAALFAMLLVGGIYFICNYTAFGLGSGQTAVFWFFFVLAALFMAEQVVAKIIKQWRNCTVEGSLE